MKTFKSVLAMLLAMSMVLVCFAGCGSNGSGSAASGATTQSAESAATGETAEPEAPAESAAPAASAPEASAAEENIIDSIGTQSMSFEDEIEAAASGEYVQYLMDFDYPEETELPVTDEDVTFSYFFSTQPFMMAYGGEVDYDALTFYREWTSRTGVKLDLIPVSLMEADTKFQLMIASGDYANMIEGIEGYTGGAGAAINDEVIYPMDDLLDAYMPNYAAWLEAKPDARKECSTVEDGTLYRCGYIRYGAMSLSFGGILNQDWLDETGKDVPVTYEDMEDVLLAMKDQGHSGALWMTSALATVGNMLNSGYEVNLEDGWLVKDGQIEYSFVSDNMKDYLTMLHNWYEAGLIYPEFMTIDPSSDTIENGLVTGQVVGVYAGAWDAAETLEKDGGIHLTPFAALRQEAGQQLHVAGKIQYCQGGCAIATSVDQDLLPVAAKMLDYLYSKDGVILSNYGVEGEALAYDDNGNPYLTDLVVNNPSLAMSAIGLVLYTKFGGAGINFAPREYTGYDEPFWEACKVWCEDIDADYMLPFASIFTADENLECTNIMSDIETTVEEANLAFVTGNRDLADWDSYVQSVYAMGLQNAIDIYQTAYDRYAA